ncbi:MAG: CarD family transcriptional regulator [Lachnospiraceae bacterium]
MYSIHDKVMHPTEGACYIEEIMTMAVDSKDKEYYKLVPILNEKSSVFLPVTSQISGRIRLVASPDELSDLLTKLEELDIEWIADSKTRLFACANSIKSGDFFEIASLVKMMLLQEFEKPLGSKDRDFLNKAQKLIFSEIAIVQSRPYEDILSETKKWLVADMQTQ